MPAKPKHVLSELELAAMAGVSETTWRHHKAQGAPVPKSKKGVNDWLKAYHLWRQRNGKGAPGGAGGAAPMAQDAEHAKSLRELASYRAMLAKLEVARQTKMLIPRAEVVDTVARAFGIFTQRLMASVDKLATRCEGQGADVLRQELDSEFRALLSDLETNLRKSHDVDPARAASDPGAAAADEDDGQPVG